MSGGHYMKRGKRADGKHVQQRHEAARGHPRGKQRGLRRIAADPASSGKAKDAEPSVPDGPRPGKQGDEVIDESLHGEPLRRKLEVLARALPILRRLHGKRTNEGGAASD